VRVETADERLIAKKPGACGCGSRRNSHLPGICVVFGLIGSSSAVQAGWSNSRKSGFWHQRPADFLTYYLIVSFNNFSSLGSMGTVGPSPGGLGPGCLTAWRLALYCCARASRWGGRHAGQTG